VRIDREIWKTPARVLILIGLLIAVIHYSEKFIIQRLPNRIRQMTLNNDPLLADYLDNQMVLIPAGDFLMGSDTARHDEKPAHLVYLDAYELDRFEVTNIQYQRFLIETGTTPPRYWDAYSYPAEQSVFPVLSVRWKDANAYCNWAGKRLPTEAEWEKACRGERGNTYPWGNYPKDNGGNVGIPAGGPHPQMWDQSWMVLRDPPSSAYPSPQAIGSFPSGISSDGIFDLVGNASEWTADHYNWDGYWHVGNTNPLVTEPAWNHVLRGSSWFMPYGITLDGHDLNRCSSRSSSHGDTRDARMGFRCARSVIH